MKTLSYILLAALSVPSLLHATGQQVRFALAVHSEAPGGGTNGIPVTPDFRTTDEATYRTWRTAILTFAQMCAARNLPWQFQTDWNFLEGIARFEMPTGSAYNATIDDDTANKNIVKYMHENLGVNLDPHSHEGSGYNYADVAYLLDVKCDTEPTLVVGGHIYLTTDAGYQNWPKFTASQLGLKAKLYAATNYRWRPHLLMGGGTSSHSADPHIAGLWRPLDANNYFTDSPSGSIAAVGNWEQDFFASDTLLRFLESNTLPHNNKLWTIGRVLNHRDMAQPGYLTTYAASILDTIAAWRDAGRFQVKTFEDIYTEWLAAPYNGQSSLYQRPVDNITFSLNWQDFAYTERSNTELRTLLNYHEAKQVPVDVFLTTWQTDILEAQAPELLGRLFSSRWVNMAYHVRAPKPYASNYAWRSVTSADIATYESNRLNMVTGQPDTSASGGYAKLTSLYGAAPRIVGPNADTTVSSLVHGYFGGAGGAMLVIHDSAAAVNLGTKANNVYVRPENYDWRLIEVYNGTSSVTTIDQALASARTTSGSVPPYFVGVKLHDNDLFATQSAWTAIYQDTRRVPNWDPYNSANWAALLETSDANEPARRRNIYLGIVDNAASRRASLNLMDARDTLSLLAADAPRMIGLSTTEVEEDQPVGTVLAEISGGGVESGVSCTYSLTSGAGAEDNAKFSINGANLVASSALDYESHPVNHLRLRWADGSGNSGERAMTLVLSNVTTDDDDGDGFTEAEELLAGTDPENASSRLAITSTQLVGNQITVNWTSVSGHLYHLESSSDLRNWTPINNTSTTAIGANSSITIGNLSGDRMFFRVATD